MKRRKPTLPKLRPKGSLKGSKELEGTEGTLGELKELRELGEMPDRQGQLLAPLIQRQELRQDQIRVAEEADYIIHKAEMYDARLVTLGPLVFFSTETGDAWVLDPGDGLALCLARGGERQPFTIVETDTTFSIEWTANYRIEGNRFIVAERSGRVRTILGYPVSEIRRALRSAGQGAFPS